MGLSKKVGERITIKADPVLGVPTIEGTVIGFTYPPTPSNILAVIAGNLTAIATGYLVRPDGGGPNELVSDLTR